MSLDVYRRIIDLVLQAAKLARTVGINNILQPGLVKEMIIANHLGHKAIITKRDADACDPSDLTILYEYLSCKEGGTGQLDRMFKEPAEKREESLQRIWRNSKIYFAVFFEDDQTRAKVIYEIEPDALATETGRQLGASRNAISHVGLSENWVKRHGKVVYRDSNDG